MGFQHENYVLRPKPLTEMFMDRPRSGGREVDVLFFVHDSFMVEADSYFCLSFLSTLQRSGEMLFAIARQTEGRGNFACGLGLWLGPHATLPEDPRSRGLNFTLVLLT